MVSTRSSVRMAHPGTVASGGSDVESELSSSSSSSMSASSASAATTSPPSRMHSTPSHEHESTTVMTRKRRLIQQIQADIAIGTTPYWEDLVNWTEWDADDEGSLNSFPRRSRRGEARRRYEDAVGVSRVAEKMAVNLPPMLNTREGKLLAVEVFGDTVRKHLPMVDKGPRVGHCSSGYVCGYPVLRGKEGNSWCQTPVKASLDSKLACVHHLHRRTGTGGPTRDQRHFMLLADDFYDKQGDLCWLRVVSHLRSLALPLELQQRRQVIAAGDRALAISDVKIVLHGFRQCTMFWLAVCRLTRRRFNFSMVAHASKSEFKEFLTDLRGNAPLVPPPPQASSPFVCVADARSGVTCYYASGYDQVCRMF